MAILKCKMCGGSLDVTEGMTVCECEYCGTMQTIPQVDDEKKITLFTRANRLRAACEFDKAAGVYENIVSDFPEEAEAYWGLVLCKFGIEYVDDPATGKKIPTCHRSSFESIMDDPDFEQTMENADPIARKVYREEAKTIDGIQKGILELSGKEEPYDIFICYKETDDSGNRTVDSVMAQDIYDMLTENKYRVFFARISLEDKLGTAYEPYIFAALNSARIMLAVGTDYEYYNAVWVKNEWSRFLAMMSKDKKKVLIPCYKGIDAYDIPKEFKHLQAQDMGKVGAMQDLLRGIKKILPKDTVVTQVTQVVQGGANVTSLLQRVFMFLEDGDWQSAEEFCHKVLDIEPKNANAYLGLALAQNKKSTKDIFVQAYIQGEIKTDDKNLKRARQFADEKLKTWLEEIDEKRTEEEKRRAEKYAEKRKLLALARERISKYSGLISAGGPHTVGLKADGTAVAVGFNGWGQCNVFGWKNIIAVSTSNRHTVGLKADGTVVAVGDNTYEDEYVGQCNVSSWKNIIAISAGYAHTVGLKADGTVVAVGCNNSGQCNVSSWKDIIAVSAEASQTVGLKADGTVVAVGDNKDGQCNVSDWKDIIAVSSGYHHTVGLKADGTVVAVGSNTDLWKGNVGRCDLSGWKDIIAVSAGADHTVGLKADGTVVAVGSNTDVMNKYTGQCNVSGWKDIIAVSAGYYHTVGLKADGTMVAVGDNKDGQCNVSGWKLFKSEIESEKDYSEACRLQDAAGEVDLKKAYVMFSSIKYYLDSKARADICKKAYEEKTAIRKEQERKKKIAMLNTEKHVLQTEYANLKGLFSGRRRKEIDTRLAQIEYELNNL